jgi:endo-alpha-1,4-polygalactosaminidase (GH114 family)
LASLQRKPDGTQRLVLAHLSIGEAEDTRTYWRKEWVTDVAVLPRQSKIAAARPPAAYGLAAAHRSHLETAAAVATPIPDVSGLRVPSPRAPSWLGTENPEWRGYYKVRFWDFGWQTLIFGSAEAALDRIMSLGFDGVFLQKADVHGAFASEHATAENDMVDFIVRLSEYARQHRPGFLVVMQNAEELLAHRRLRRSIDAVAKEDLLYGVTGPGEENDAADVKASLYYLEHARRTGRPIFVVERLEDAAKVAVARRRLTELGFVAYFASGDRGRLKLQF